MNCLGCQMESCYRCDHARVYSVSCPHDRYDHRGCCRCFGCYFDCYAGFELAGIGFVIAADCLHCYYMHFDRSLCCGWLQYAALHYFVHPMHSQLAAVDALAAAAAFAAAVGGSCVVVTGCLDAVAVAASRLCCHCS